MQDGRRKKNNRLKVLPGDTLSGSISKLSRETALPSTSPRRAAPEETRRKTTDLSCGEPITPPVESIERAAGRDGRDCGT
jgi:hypothetical protein